MNDRFVPFDAVRPRVMDLIKRSGSIPHGVGRLYLIRDLFGKVRIAVSDDARAEDACRGALQCLADRMKEALGEHGYAARDAVLFVDSDRLSALEDEAVKIASNAYWIDRLMTGGDWRTVSRLPRPEGKPRRYTLFSVKGGIGRSTTAAVLAWHLARNGKRVLVLDLDLESPGLSSAMLDPQTQPEFGVTDWFVEDLVGQGDRVIERMTAEPPWPAGARRARCGWCRLTAANPVSILPSWAVFTWAREERPGTSASVVCCHSSKCGTSRRSCYWRAAADCTTSRRRTVTDLDAQVLLFATRSESNWTDYGILFHHWQRHGLARSIRGPPVDRVRADSRAGHGTVSAEVSARGMGPVPGASVRRCERLCRLQRSVFVRSGR